MLSLKLIASVLLTGIVFVGCKEQTKTVEPNDKDQGRPSTKTLQAVDLVGYDGKQLRKTTGRVLDANDKRNQDMQKVLEDNE